MLAREVRDYFGPVLGVEVGYLVHVVLKVGRLVRGPAAEHELRPASTLAFVVHGYFFLPRRAALQRLCLYLRIVSPPPPPCS